MIIQHYSFSMTDEQNELVYDGTTYFGFFSKAALSEQIGIRDAAPLPSISTVERSRYPEKAPFADRQLAMLDAFATTSDGVLGWKQVDPAEWFFAAHFFQDPVMPGSLGLEAFLQLIQVEAERKWQSDSQFQAPILGQTHQWTYRGQVLPSNREVSVQARIAKIDERSRMIWADGILGVDGRVIYRMTGFTAQG
jgi:3-hydroxymyristoyl/3-hydroxydecanoyl-(acyl carrier protein) dehydratase